MHSFPLGATAVNEWAASTVGGDQHTASPWGVTHRSANTGDVAGLQNEAAVQRRSELKLAGCANQAMLAVYPAAITSHTSYD